MITLVNAEAGRIPLGDGVVHCSISSPPYWSLRQYSGDQARERLGFVALDEWEHGMNGKEGEPLGELPLFEALVDLGNT